MALADFTNSPALAGFISEVFLVVVAMQLLYNLLLSTLLSIHEQMADRYGMHAALTMSTFAVVTVAHMVGLLLTLPALHHVKFGKIQTRKVATLRRVLKDMPLVGFNYLLSIVVGSVVAILSCKTELHHDVRAGLPDSELLAMQSIFSLLVSEVIFYHVHRAFHENKFLYARIHKIHHTWPAPVAIMSTYAHPLEHICCNLVTVFAGPLLCGAHPFMALCYSMLFAMGAMVHHSGYWSDDLGMHDLHHEIFNVNYGNAHILDYLYGTYRSQSLCADVKVAKLDKSS